MEYRAKDTKRYRGLSRAGLLLLSVLTPCVIIYLGDLILHVMPFGDKTLSISDGQFYIYALPGFSRLFHGEGSLLYSLQNGLGGNMWSTLAWGELNPVHLLAYFATPENAPELFTWMCMLNMALCGLTMYILLANTRGWRLDGLIFSTSYALMGFNVAFCYHYLFFIGPQLLPLMILGLLRLLQGKSPLLYTLSLGICIFFNFYFGFILCAASVIVFTVMLFADSGNLKGRRARLIRIYAFSSLFAGLLAAPMWLPALKAYSGGRITQSLNRFEFTLAENMPFLQIFTKLFSGANSDTEQQNGLPFIFCGIFAVALVVLYFQNRKIEPRKKRAAGVVLGIYLLTFYLDILTRLMHGGTHTNWFNYRYSFVFSFFLLALAAEELPYVGELASGEIRRCAALMAAGVALVFSQKYDYISGGYVVLDLTLLAMIWGVYRLHLNKPNVINARVFSIFVLLIVSANLLGNYVFSLKDLLDPPWGMDLATYRKNSIMTGSAVDGLNLYDQTFFRMEKDVSESGAVGSDPFLYNYHGVSHGGPTERDFVHRGLCRLGINRFDMRHWYSEGVPAATDALLGLKYIIAVNDLVAEKGYEKLGGNSNFPFYENPNYLSVAILADEGFATLELGSNAFENLNEVWKALAGGNDDIFHLQKDITFTLHNAIEQQTVTSDELKISASNSEAGIGNEDIDQTRIFADFTAEHSGALYRFDTSTPDSESGMRSPCVKYVGTYQIGEPVQDTSMAETTYAPPSMFLDSCNHFSYAFADAEVLAEYAKQVNSRDISFSVEKDTLLTGSFTAAKQQRILFTIPWDEGWTCYIDGKAVPIDKTWDLFMSVSVPEGRHSYEMKFFPVWLNYGLYLCGVAFVGLTALMIVWKRKNKTGERANMETEQMSKGVIHVQ